MKFEDKLADLERVVAALEAGDVPLEDALGLFERGVGLVRELGQQLDAVERKLELLTRNAAGELEIGESEEPRRDG